MSGPVIAATATRVAAFSPLLFWPGVVGQFMKYLPITLIATLSASLAVALFFTPTLGALLGRAAPVPHDERRARNGPYMRTVRLALRHPGMTLALAAFLLIAVQIAYGKFGRGVEFFPNVEPDYGQVHRACARQSLARREEPPGRARSRSACSTSTASRPSTRASASSRAASSEITEDTIGVIQFEFADWRQRPPAHEIMDAIRDKTADIPGILVEVTAPRAGPPTGKPIQVQLAALDPDVLPAAAKKVAAHPVGAQRRPRSRRRPAAARHRLEDRGRQGGGREIRRQRQHRRQRACSSSPTALKATEYRPVDSDKAVDILVRFPPDRRSLDQIDDLRIQTPVGHVPIGNFVAARAGASASATSTASTATA